MSSTLPAPSVLLQGRNLRGSLPFLPAELSPKFVPSTFVRKELAVRQSQAAFSQPHSPSTRTSALLVGQCVRAFVKGRWLRGVVHSVCPEPQSYIVRLDDGRLFRRTRWAINIDHGHVSLPCPSVAGPAIPSSITPVPRFSHPSGVTPRPCLASQVQTPVSAAVATPVRSSAPAVPVGPATPLLRRRSCSFRSHISPVRLFEPPRTPLLSHSSVVPPPEVSPVLPRVEPFGTTRSGARFGISMSSVQKQ